MGANILGRALILGCEARGMGLSVTRAPGLCADQALCSWSIDWLGQRGYPWGLGHTPYWAVAGMV